VVVWTTWPEADLTLPSFSKLPSVELISIEKDMMVLTTGSFSCADFEIKR